MRKGRLVHCGDSEWKIYFRGEGKESHQTGVATVCDEDCNLLTPEYNNLEIEFKIIEGKAKLVFNIDI